MDITSQTTPTATGTLLAGTSAFGAALRRAIQHSGLSLEELSQRLRDRRTPVSASALSYWQNGDNQPERARSLAAVTVLEDLLDLPPGALTELIGPRRPRGRWVPRTSGMGFDKLWRLPDAVVRALAKVDATPDDLNHPLKVSQHLSYRVDASGHEESVRVRRLIRADRDNTTRVIFVSRCSTLPQPPMVTFADGCQPGRFRADVPTNTCVFEFLLPRPLRAGEMAAVEFGLRYPPGQTDRHAEIAIYQPVRDLVLQVTFDPHRLPARCYAYWQGHVSQPAERREERTLDCEARSFQFINLDPAPGQYGIAWQWT
ncbi:helix-turn-helix domain-containing protein [Longispora urticae]